MDAKWDGFKAPLGALGLDLLCSGRNWGGAECVPRVRGKGHLWWDSVWFEDEGLVADNLLLMLCAHVTLPVCCVFPGKVELL